MQLQAGASAALPGYGHPTPDATFLPGGGCALPGLRTRQEGEGLQAMQLQAGASAAPPGNEHPARRHGPA